MNIFYGNFSLEHPNPVSTRPGRRGVGITRKRAKQAPSRAQKRSRRIARGGSKRR